MSRRFGATILDAEGLRLTPEERRFFTSADPFGFILFARNIDTPGQVRALCAEMRDAVGRDAPITIDQEGGRVQRLRGPRWREWLPPLEHVQRAGPHAEAAMYLRYRIIAHELNDLGIDSNCAPMVDVATPRTHAFLQNRCYGFEAATVARLGRAAADGMLAGGVLPVLKHIPGHGRAVVDSHFDLPVVTDSVETLWQNDFAPFRALNDLPMGMTAHLVYAALDDAPATLSETVMTLIRDQIGFDGLIMTDDISMKALRGSLSDLARSALAAGCDVILHCNGTLEERRMVAEAAGRMDASAQARAERAHAARRTPDEVDIAALAAKLEALLDGRLDD
ncbi:beta-N-acetylhexosaminidase [Lutimaribacter sp. EGI FJ00015]|uniref:Beta-N-acetylhexosaminidase n=1 Tax=Lutimaribacter degradans TaxID=2945989 RepID=A0ACC5ZVN3_9RHOB|nr:beta-N-acetylhexosaminidase [Lutimaribacter sp. EGI FJ00013]MCO0613575.1 beta-N-acetylhexosaminidase [Lutimaribacter sp. EGI FJ00015]MCO0636547.1 beta-N-acetylhexosaminidase [Lutimaribacter sp. EGI FJ00014]